MNAHLNQEISQAKNLACWLHKKTNGRNFPSKGTSAWGVCLLQHSLDVADSDYRFVGARPSGASLDAWRDLLRESFVRGIWILRCASDEQVETLPQWEVARRIPELLKAMDDHDEAKFHGELDS